MVHDVLQKEVIKFDDEPEEEQITPMDMTYGNVGLARKSNEDQTAIIYYFGTSRELEDDEDIFVCELNLIANHTRAMDYLPDVEQITLQDAPHRSEPATESGY